MLKPNIPSKHVFQNLSLVGAINLLVKRNLMDAFIIYQGNLNLGVNSTPRILTAKYSTATLARSVGPISFYGGPPNNRQWFRGSLLSFILDDVFFRRVTK